ncbi:MAG: hypothetical protein ACI9SE_003864, partial [Neolewinella sp.]
YPVQTTGCAKRNLWFEPGTVRRSGTQIRLCRFRFNFASSRSPAVMDIVG